ncbi:hypothetical protein ABZ609_05755 [Streptomyces rubiginosohelvolus]|uniref:hypothetical protein n=1 Tax=Streptomyces rubiginosohelvolus TaxID=67362 RepID=UPI0033C0E454
MANTEWERRRFGAVRKLPSGRFQARYQGPDGLTRSAPETFASQTNADRWLVRKEAEIIDGKWKNPADKVLFGVYADAWVQGTRLRGHHPNATATPCDFTSARPSRTWS